MLSMYFVFHKWKVSGDPTVRKHVATIFPTAFLHFVFLSHVLVILTNFHSYMMVIGGQQSLVLLSQLNLGAPQTSPT